MNLVARNIDIVIMPLTDGAAVLHPEGAVLQFESGLSLDFGAVCYAQRTSPVGQRKSCDRPKSERLVDLASLIPARLERVGEAVRYFSEQMYSGGKRPATAFTSARHYTVFLDWAEQAGFGDVIVDEGALRLAFPAFVEHLRLRVDTGQIGNNTAAVAQNSVLTVAAELSQLDDLHHGCNLLRVQKHARQATIPPSEGSRARVLALCQALFDGLSNLCLNFELYPYALPVPPSLGATGNRLWVFPANKWCMAPHELAVRDELTCGYWAYDYENGRISEIAEITERYSHNPAKQRRGATAELLTAQATQGLKEANSERQHHFRRRAALLAHNAFIVLFLANTCMNWAVLRGLPWAQEHEISTERQGFRAVKYRAGGRLVSFEIGAVFLPTFRKFLLLRAFLLNQKPLGHLFLASSDWAQTFAPLKGKGLTNIIQSLHRLDPGLPSIKSKGWRASKSDWLLRRVDPATAAAVLQTTEATMLASYAEGSPSSQGEELSAFFDQLQSAVIESGAVVKDGVVNAVGICTSFGKPRQVVNAPVASDCRGPEGCLFCDKFKVHADEKDTRKIVSCRFCIMQTSHLVRSEEHFRDVVQPLLDRIEDLLKEIDHREAGLVKRIEQEVEAGELDPYWASKLEMLVDLELAG
ncbi:hypothetical protein BTHE68_62270 (plasmid) [Burkholderia sp. THE68]|uniref:hypothetical protein n=1 Tax=Burkholderia sp. THE68 TaxID=758782 RepID=UPI001316A513|nr:hypothetical protein [Burkholderia sp. THE68]BBU32493.1 hypothetical protein BTHE68_62270 [Burkholderia sp. THE68]